MKTTVESLPILVLYPHARCNCRCLMCDIWKNSEAAELSVAELARHMADIEKLAVRWVVFSGGEPLMHSDLFRLTAMLRKRGIRITVLSTGLLLGRFAHQVATTMDDVIVSLDGPSAIHDEIRRVPGAFAALKCGVAVVRLHNQSLPIAARCTIQHKNHANIAETIETARSLGLTSISFLAADMTSSAFSRNLMWDEGRQSQIALTEEEIDTLEHQFAHLEQGFVLESAEKLDRIVNHFRAHLRLSTPVAPRCNAPWVSAVIETDGTVRPCFFQKPIGSLRSHSLIQVLNGFEAQQFRASLKIETDPICARCVCSLHYVQLESSARG